MTYGADYMPTWPETFKFTSHISLSTRVHVQEHLHKDRELSKLVSIQLAICAALTKERMVTAGKEVHRTSPDSQLRFIIRIMMYRKTSEKEAMFQHLVTQRHTH